MYETEIYPYEPDNEEGWDMHITANDDHKWEDDDQFEIRMSRLIQERIDNEKQRKLHLEELKSQEYNYQQKLYDSWMTCRGNGGPKGNHELYLLGIHNSITDTGKVETVHYSVCRQCGAAKTTNIDTGIGHWKIGKMIIHFGNMP